MRFSFFDKNGRVLLLTTEVRSRDFDAVTCSPRADGFTVLNSLGIASIAQAQILSACAETIRRNEVCVLPVGALPDCRVFLTPTVRSLQPESRIEARRLMDDLFLASQAVNPPVASLLITHFANVRLYPDVHVLGVLDSLKSLVGRSFGCLGVVGIQLREEHQKDFLANVNEVFSGA